MTRGAGFLVKWGIVPACFALIGFFWIGPHYAGDPRLKGLVQKGQEVVQSHGLKEAPPSQETPLAAEPAKETKPDSFQAPAPRVSVEVKPVNPESTVDEKPRRRHRRRRRETPPSEAAPEPVREPERTGPDPASTP